MNLCLIIYTNKCEYKYVFVLHRYGDKAYNVDIHLEKYPEHKLLLLIYKHILCSNTMRSYLSSQNI